MKLTIDSPFIQKGIKLTNLLILNGCFLIGCLGLITIGTSLIAAFTVALKMVDDSNDDKIIRSFFAAYKANMKHGIILTLLIVGVTYGIWMNWQLFDKLDNSPMMFLICAIVALILLMAHILYVFPLEARYENSLLQALVNSRKICIRFFLKTLMLVGILVVQFLLFACTAPFLSYLAFFFGPAVMIYTTAQIALPIFESLEINKYESDGFAVGQNA